MENNTGELEPIKEHFLKDVYRIQEGLLLEVRKYKEVRGYYLYDIKDKSKSVKGCSGARELTQKYVSKSGEITFEKGTYFMGAVPIKPTSDPEEFRIELRSSGGIIGGTIEDMQDVTNKVQIILRGYEVWF